MKEWITQEAFLLQQTTDQLAASEPDSLRVRKMRSVLGYYKTLCSMMNDNMLISKQQEKVVGEQLFTLLNAEDLESSEIYLARELRATFAYLASCASY